MPNEVLVNRIKACGQTLIDEADKIANSYRNQRDLTITIYFSETIPEINVDTTILPTIQADTE